MIRSLAAALALIVVTGCETQPQSETPQIGSPERDTRDSIIGQSKLPGAKAVESARDVNATAKERAAELDSIR
jgi:hypothetical protein